MRRVAEAVVSAMTGRMGFAAVGVPASSSTVGEVVAAVAAAVTTIVMMTDEMTDDMMIDDMMTDDTMIVATMIADTTMIAVGIVTITMTVVGTDINLLRFPFFLRTVFLGRAKRNGKHGQYLRGYFYFVQILSKNMATYHLSSPLRVLSSLSRNSGKIPERSHYGHCAEFY